MRARVSTKVTDCRRRLSGSHRQQREGHKDLNPNTAPALVQRDDPVRHEPALEYCAHAWGARRRSPGGVQVDYRAGFREKSECWLATLTV